MKDKVLIDPTLMDEDKYAENLVEESAEILLRADEIRKDKKLMEQIHSHWDSKDKKIKSLRDLKDLSNNFSKDEEDED